MESSANYYILFKSHTQGWALHKLLDDHQLPNRITPTPRCKDLKVACGMSILIKPEDIEAVTTCIKEYGGEHEGIVKVDGQLNPMRDQYC